MAAKPNKTDEARTTLPLFYKKVVPLNKENHKNLYIEPVEGFEFAAGTNSLYIAAVEFPRAARDYPIVFAKDGKGSVFPMALLGLKKGQNLYVNRKGEWKASYIPAYARRYPFILATPPGQNNQFAVCIDESYAGFNTAKEGQPLFNAQGEQTKLLNQAVEFLKDYETQVRLTATFCRNLVEAELLDPMQANISLKSGEKFAVGGFLCVKREKLKALPPKKLSDMLKSDQIELIFLHLQSLNNMSNLTGKVD